MKTLNFHHKWQLAIILLMPAHVAFSQDDLYYFPSKHKGENIQSTTVRGTDTSGMTDYERYRALKEKENSNSNNDSSNNSETIKQEPSVVVVKNDSTSGNVIVNNYYIDDDRFAYYRRFYLDYYYDPFWYDPFYWDYYYGWGGPYVGFYYSWGYPYYGYYGYYGYWHRPWYSSYYFGYWNGFYSGFYWGYYADNLPTRGIVNYTPGRRMGGYVNISRTEDAAYYSGRFASNDYYHGTRRNRGVTSFRSSVNEPSASIPPTNNANSRRTSTYNNNTNSNSANIDKSLTAINTTRPYVPSRRTSNYVPTYNMNNQEIKTEQRRRTTTENNNYVVTNTRQVRNANPGNQGNVSAPSPRRSTDSYTPPVRTSSSSSGQYNGSSNNNNSGSYIAPRPSSGSTSTPAPSHNNSGSGRRR